MLLVNNIKRFTKISIFLINKKKYEILQKTTPFLSEGIVTELDNKFNPDYQKIFFYHLQFYTLYFLLNYSIKKLESNKKIKKVRKNI